MIHVVATIDVKPGMRKPFLEILNSNCTAVRSEDRCILYEPAVDVSTELPPQVAMRENTVTILESWLSLDHLRAHLSAPHMTEYRTRVKDLVEGVSLQVLTPA